MTENERKAIDALQDMITEGQSNGDVIVARDDEEELKTAIQALEELQQYRAIGTVEEIQQKLKNMSLVIDTDRDLLNRYIAIGTIDEFKALKEKNTPLEHHHTRIDDINDKVRVSVCPSCLSIIFTHSEEYPNFCVSCGQKLDWSE